MNECPPPVLVWPACDIPTSDDQDDAHDVASYVIGAALHEAARQLAEVGPCPSDHFEKGFDETGAEILELKGPGLVMGDPSIDPDCCGAISTGIVYPAAIGLDGLDENNCITIFEMEFVTKVTWCDANVYDRTVEANRLQRLLLRHTCCLLENSYPKAGFQVVAFGQDESQKCKEFSMTTRVVGL